MHYCWKTLGYAIVHSKMREDLVYAAEIAKSGNLRPMHNLLNNDYQRTETCYLSRLEIGEVARIFGDPNVATLVEEIHLNCWDDSALPSDPTEREALYTALGILYTDSSWCEALVHGTTPPGGHPMELPSSLVNTLKAFLTTGLKTYGGVGALELLTDIEERVWEPGSCANSATYSPDYRHTVAMRAVDNSTKLGAIGRVSIVVSGDTTGAF